MHGEKTRLLMGIPHPTARGGPPTHLPMLVDYFRGHSGYEIRTFYYGSKLFGTERGQRESVLRKIFITSSKIIEYVYVLCTFRPRIVHLNTSFDKLTIMRDLPFALVSKVFGRKLILKIHGNNPDLINTKNWIQIRMIKCIFWCATKIGVLSNAEKQVYRRQFGYSEKLVVTKNIVARDELTYQTTQYEKIENELYGLFVSRVEEMKGLQDLIRAMVKVRKEIPNFKLIVAGDGPDMKKCIGLADRLELDESITWLGYVDNLAVQSLYRQCDVFVFPTHYPEGMPMVLVEALKAGIPIITTEVRFAMSYLNDRVNCLFVDKGDTDDLSAKIINILNDPRLQTIMRRENPKIVDKFRKATVGREFEDIYQSMLIRHKVLG